MSCNDLRENHFYTDNQGRFRKIVAFFDGFDRERRVRYEKGYIWPNGNWQRFEVGECSKQTFARWAKAFA